MSQRTSTIRRGIGLFEVIACTGLVAMMLIPLAGVIRTSGQSISHSNGDGSKAFQMRQALRFLNQVLREGEIRQFRQNRITVRRPNGRTVSIGVRGQALEMRDGSDRTSLVEGVRRVRFIQRRQRSGDRLRTGIEIQLNARDPETRRNVRIVSALAFPT